MTKLNLISVMLIIAMLALAGCSSKEEASNGEQNVTSTEADLSQDNETINDETIKQLLETQQNQTSKKGI